jgi:serine/threonine-protein kinase RsbW
MGVQSREKKGEGKRSVCPDPGDWCLKILHSSHEIVALLDDLLEEMQAAGYSNKEMFGVRLALEEALVNAIKHGHHHDPSKSVSFRYQLTAGSLLVEIQDEGPGFCPEDVPDPLAPENWERSSGRGLLLMRTYMTWVRYNDKGTCVTLCKQRAG